MRLELLEGQEEDIQAHGQLAGPAAAVKKHHIGTAHGWVHQQLQRDLIFG
jgi:hypothetical protein